MRTFRERVYHAALDTGLGRKYGHTGDATTDCVRYWYAILVDLLGEQTMEAINKAWHLNGYGLGSMANVEALVGIGVAEWVDYPQADGGIYLGQGWTKKNGKWKSGHLLGVVTFAGPLLTSAFWLLESNRNDDWFRPIDLDDRVEMYDAMRWVQLLDPYDP